MKKFYLLVVVFFLMLMLFACSQGENFEREEETENNEVFVDSSHVMEDESAEEGIEESTEDVNTEVTEENNGNWVSFDECFYGEYSNGIPFDNGKDADGRTIWGTYEGAVKISKDYIFVDVPEGKFELTPENSRLEGDNYLTLNMLDKDVRFIIHNKENLLAGIRSIEIQTNFNQYKLYKEQNN